MAQVPVWLRRWGRSEVIRMKVKKQPVTDRDRWVYIRTSYTKEDNQAFYEGEYDKLLADKRVAQLVVGEQEGIKLITIPILKVLLFEEVQHCVYLGTNEVHVHLAPFSVQSGSFTIAKTTSFKVHCIQSGRYDAELKTTYPVNTEHNFCFGVRRPFIENLANTGELYTFFNVVLDSLWHINPTSKESIIRDFRKVTDAAEIEPYRRIHESLVNPFCD